MSEQVAQEVLRAMPKTRTHKVVCAKNKERPRNVTVLDHVLETFVPSENPNRSSQTETRPEQTTACISLTNRGGMLDFYERT